ncbi:MAG TPA: UrcA family protein [Steroidobacteraceae bacterium]
MKALFPTLTLALLMGACTDPVLAGVSTDSPQLAVRFHDLSLHTAAGVAKLYARINGAAALVCERVVAGDPWAGIAFRACKQRAVERAVLNVNSPELTAYYRARTEKGLAIAWAGK